MARVTKTELNQQTARVLARVAAGERLTITDRGVPIAEIVPAKPMSRWEELVAAGKVRLATKSGPLPFVPVRSDVSSQEILDDIRRDHS
ncbi:type II toxin-antitoxin system Phd/YefM family antitoxin [Humibacter ginsengisoli]